MPSFGGLKRMFGTSSADMGDSYYTNYVPPGLNKERFGSGVINSSGGVSNIKNLMESRGEVSGLSKDYEIGEIERSRGAGQNRAASAAHRSGLGVSGAANARYRGVDESSDLRRQEAVARWRRESEQRRRDDIAQIYMPYSNQYLEAAWRRVQGLTGNKQAASANKVNYTKGVLNSFGGGF